MNVGNMFDPSAQKLVDTANESILNEKDKVKSRYTVIIAAAKRARQLIDNQDERVNGGANALSVAVDELRNKSVKITKEE